MRMYLKKLRKNKSISETEVAKAMSISRQYYNMIENGSRQSSLRMNVVQKLSEILEIPLPALMELENKYQAERTQCANQSTDQFNEESTIGYRIKILREQNNMTQEDLANNILSTKQSIYKYEKGIIFDIPPSKLELLAKALNTTPAYLMGWDGYKEIKK